MLAAILSIIGTIGVVGGYAGLKNAEVRNKAQNELRQVVNNSETLQQLSINDMLDQAYYMNYITEDEKSKYTSLLKELNTSHGFWESLNLLDPSSKKSEEIARLYGILTKISPQIEQVMNQTVGADIKGMLASSIPAIANAPTPGYLDTDFENKWVNRDANPLKWWTGKELAEYNDLPYDIDVWYDAVKKGTEANVARDMYTSDQLRYDAVKDRPWEQASYLSSLSDTKGASIAKGATAGAQAANELLGLLNANQASVDTQAQTADARWNAVNESLRADAQAMLTAEGKYQNLGLNIANAIEGLYENDVIRRQAELEAFAGLNSADETLRNARIQANADMNRAYTENQAIIDAARQGMNNTANRYAWMWDRFYNSALEQGKSEVASRAFANNRLTNWMFQQSTGTQNFSNYLAYKENNY